MMASQAWVWLFKSVKPLLVVVLCFTPKLSALGAKNGDEITKLPGQPPVKFAQYAGYITVEEMEQRALFYYFVEAHTDPLTKPLVLWLNGGPGCSSVGSGAFSEHGPFRPKGDGLVINYYSWNKEANILYLESPAGVGFSYTSNQSYYVNDEITARYNLKFLLKWLKRYPEYKNRDFYITGESYAGHYVPQLASVLLKTELRSNLKGIALGNPLLDFNTDLNSYGEYFWSHGLISDSTYAMLNSICNASQIVRQNITGNISSDCLMVYAEIGKEIGEYVDLYDVTSDVCLSSLTSQALRLNPMVNIARRDGVDVCTLNETATYLNRKDVQTALHAKLVGIDKWSLCNLALNYDLRDEEIPMVPLLRALVKQGIRVLVYSGDQDSVIPLMGTRTLVNTLAKDMGLNTTAPYRSWLQDKQVGGWTQVYNNTLSFATVRGAGHQAPLTQPARSLALFKYFLQGKAPPLANS